MGNSVIVIHAVGPHHNGQRYDAEQLASRLGASLELTRAVTLMGEALEAVGAHVERG